MSFNVNDNHNINKKNTNNRAPRQDTKEHREKEPYVPQIDDFQGTIGRILERQIDAFYSVHLPQLQQGATPSNENIRITENHLFNLPEAGDSLNSWHCTVKGFDGLEIYVLERTSRLNRKTLELARASLNAVVLRDGIPAYFISAFVNAAWKGKISVCPIDNFGPKYKDTLVINIVKGDQAES